MNRSGLITFCGVGINVKFDVNGPSGRGCIDNYENGFYRNGIPIVSRHPNIVKSVLVGKKGWGLWVKEWSDGIGDGLFTKEEIMHEIESRGIELPKSMMDDFDTLIERRKCGGMV